MSSALLENREKEYSFNDAQDISDIEIQLSKLESQINHRKHRQRTILYILGGSIIIGLGIIVYALISKVTKETESNLFLIVGILFYPFIIGGVMYFLNQRKIESLDQDIAVLSARKRVISKTNFGVSLTAGTTISYFDRLVDINLTNLSAYYGLVKVHANNSFFVATVAGAVGFALIILGLIIGFTNIDPSKTITFVSSASGVVTEFIAVVFFYLYNKTIQQLKGYHDSLLSVQNILLSFKLVGDTEDSNDKAKMVGQMLLYLIGKQHGYKEETKLQQATINPDKIAGA